MPQQLEDMTSTLDENEQCIIIQEATAEEIEEDEESSSLRFGKYDKYFQTGDGDYERLYRVAKLVLPTALYVTWKSFVDFQVKLGSSYITNKRFAEYINKDIRTVELNIQRLRQAGFLHTRHVLRGENWVVEKNFSVLYQTVIEYMQWERSPAYMPPTREYFEVDGVDKDICRKVLRFNNYRRILHNKRPGPKRKKIYPEEQTFIDGVFRELTIEQNPSPHIKPVEPVSAQLATSSGLPEKTSIQATPEAIQGVVQGPGEAATPLSEKKNGQMESADTQVIDAGLPVVAVSVQAEISKTEAAVVLSEKKSVRAESADVQVVEPSKAVGIVSVPSEISDSEMGIVGAKVEAMGAEPMEEESLSEMGSAHNEIGPVQPGAIEVQGGLEGQGAIQEQGQDIEEIKKKIMAEYRRIAKEHGQEEAMQWMSTQELDWMQSGDWDAIFEEENACNQPEDGMEQQEENVVEQEPACENKKWQIFDEQFDPIDEFEPLMDHMVGLRRDHMIVVGEWYQYLHEMYDEYGRFIVDCNLIRYPARTQPKVPFARFLHTDQKYRCLRNSRDRNYSEAEFITKLDVLLDNREAIYQATEDWERINAWIATYHDWGKVDKAYLERLSREEIKELLMTVSEPKADPAKPLKDRFIKEQNGLGQEKDKKMREEGGAS